MDQLTSPQGTLGLAITALLLVVGYRLARPERAREWVAVGAYAAALVAQHLGARGLLPGPPLATGPAVRLVGSALLVAGLILAGTSARARRRAALRARAAAAPAEPVAPRVDAAHAGLALVVVAQLLRQPSTGAAVAAGVAVAVNGWVALAARRGPR